jgi:hypothetical protein
MGLSHSPNIVKDGLVALFDGANIRSFRGVPTTNYLSNPTQTFNSSEFQQYYDLRAIFETYGFTPYSLSFDMRADKPGDVYWYMQNGSYTKYAFVGHNRYATTEWQRFTIEGVTPSGPTAAWQANTPNDNRAMLATYTGYGSGVYPRVKNMQLELGSVATPFVDGTRGTTNATGGGWVDLSGNGKHGELVNGPTYNSDRGGSIVFDGSNDYISLGNVGTIGNYQTIDVWFYSTSVTNYRNILDMNYGNYGSTGNVGPRLEQYSNNTANWVWSGNTSNNSLLVGSNSYSISANTWYNATWVCDNGTVAVYLNGVATQTGISSTYGFLTTYGAASIGRGFHLDSSRYFTGRVGSVRIYNRALSATEIAQNFNSLRDRFGV